MHPFAEFVLSVVGMGGLGLIVWGLFKLQGIADRQRWERLEYQTKMEQKWRNEQDREDHNDDN